MKTAAAARVLPARRSIACRSSSRFASEKAPALDALCRQRHQAVLKNVPGVRDVGRERHDLRQAPVLSIRERIDLERGDVFLDLPVEPVENVVHALGFRDPLAVAPIERIKGSGEHRLEYIGHVQRLAGGPGKRHRRRFRRGAIEIHGPRRIGRIDTPGEAQSGCGLPHSPA
jgi:hypothetical protein